MKTLATLVLLTLALMTGTTSAAYADNPRNVHDGRSGVVEAGWIRALCAVTTDGAKCVVRFPRAVNRLYLDYFHGGEHAMTEDTTTYEKRARGPRRTLNRRVVEGVRLVCDARGNRVACDLRFADRFDSFNVNLYNAGRWFGGVSMERPDA